MKLPTVEAPRADAMDDYHGTEIADPYRWAEDMDDPETQSWVEAQNERTAQFLAATAQADIRDRIEQLWDFPRSSVPRRRDDWYFFTHNDGLQNQPVLYRRQGIDGSDEVVLDPNTFSDDGAVALVDYSVTDDATLMAYTVAEAGSDWQTIKVYDLEALKELPDTLDFAKYTSLPWLPDKSGFFYERFPEPGPDVSPSTDQKVYFHALGTPQEEDELIYERPDDPNLGFVAIISDDKSYLFLYTWRGTEPRNGLYYRRLSDEGEFVRLLEDGEAKYELAGNVGSRIFLLTDLDADRARVVSIDLEKPEREDWTEVIPEADDTLQTAVIVGDRILALYMQHASHRVRVFELDGTPDGEVELPGLGSVAELSGRQRDQESFLNFQSQLHPPTILHYALGAGSVETFVETHVDFDASAFEVTQMFATADDGVQIPMFITHRRDLSLDGSNPTMLYGYGGFDISLTPVFAPSRIAFLERGGVIVDANLRGGGEYGDNWHRAGMLENKQRVFDDFYAVAEFLIDEKWTSSQRLAILGGSNGGLLVAVAVLQRPDLFGAAVSAVPVADMLRYHLFTAGRYWIPEYGNAEEDPKHFEFLYAYSPVHNVKPDGSRPPLLITTAETDDRVVPMHAWKLAAALQEVAEPEQVVLLRTERRAGHGLGKPISKVIDEAADIYAFLVETLGMD